MTRSKGRALVTGGAGFIGSHLVDLLLEQGYEVSVLDILEEQTHPTGKPKWIPRDVRFIQGDIRNESHLSRALQKVQFVFHQAAFVGFTEQISKYFDVNVIGTARIFELISTGKFQIEKMVTASSQAVYGEGAYQCEKDGLQFPETRPFDQLQKKDWELHCPKCGRQLQPTLTAEDKPRKGQTPYALSKEFEERLALSYGKKLGIPVVALRYGVTFGPRQSVFNPYTGVVSIFSTRLLNDLPPLVYEDGKQTRDFIYVGDVARANLFVMENAKANDQVLNVSQGKSVTIAEIAKTLASIYKKPIEPEIPGQFRWGDVRHVAPDPSRLKRLGFVAVTPLKEGLGLFADWMREQGPVEERFSCAHMQLKKNQIVYE